MAKKSTLTDTEQVTLHIQSLDTELVSSISYLREIILNTDPSISEHIKWNNPCFYYSGEIAAFNPKEYKREIIVLNLFKGRIMLVFPSGEKVNDTTGFLTGDYKDGRRVTVFKDLEDITSKKNALQTIIKK